MVQMHPFTEEQSRQIYRNVLLFQCLAPVEAALAGLNRESRLSSGREGRFRELTMTSVMTRAHDFYVRWGRRGFLDAMTNYLTLWAENQDVLGAGYLPRLRSPMARVTFSIMNWFDEVYPEDAPPGTPPGYMTNEGPVYGPNNAL